MARRRRYGDSYDRKGSRAGEAAGWRPDPDGHVRRHADEHRLDVSRPGQGRSRDRSEPANADQVRSDRGRPDAGGSGQSDPRAGPEQHLHREPVARAEASIMKEREVVIGHRLGLHARAAARLVQLSSQFKSAIILFRTDSVNSVEADARSILSILLLSAGFGARVSVRATGIDEFEAVESICRYLTG